MTEKISGDKEQTYAKTTFYFGQSNRVEEILQKVQIPKNTTTLIIGDSLLRFINARGIVPSQEVSHKISVSGLTTRDLIKWLNIIPKHAEIRYLLIHVGVNDCNNEPSRPGGADRRGYCRLARETATPAGR